VRRWETRARRAVEELARDEARRAARLEVERARQAARPGRVGRLARGVRTGWRRTSATLERQDVRWGLLTVFCVALMAVSVPTNAAVYGVAVSVAFLAGILQCVAPLVAMLRPRAAVALGLAGPGLVAAGVGPGFTGDVWPWPVTGIIGFSALLAVLALRQLWRLALLAWWSAVLLTVLIVVVASPLGFGSAHTTYGDNFSVFSTSSIVVLGAAAAVGQRRLVAGELAATRQDAEVEQARRIVVEERNRIARELHDVVAHSMSVIGVQATTAPYRIPGLDEAVKAEFADIAEQSRTALREMRTLLGVLRDDSAALALAPQPGLEGLEDLGEGVRRAGSSVEFAVAADVRPLDLPPATGLVVYRIVQEALSNVVRHAPGAHVEVGVERDRRPGASAGAGDLVVQVRNSPPAGDPPLGGSDRGGNGLVGVRERASLLGGTVTHGPTGEGGFLVRAVLPLDDPGATP